MNVNVCVIFRLNNGYLMLLIYSYFNNGLLHIINVSVKGVVKKNPYRFISRLCNPWNDII